ncbi:hypothetical protein D3C87_1608950 [compost metagenome]
MFQSFRHIGADGVILVRIWQLPDQQHVLERALSLLVQLLRFAGLLAPAGDRVDVIDDERGHAIALCLHSGDGVEHPAPGCQECLQRRAGILLLHLSTLRTLFQHVPLPLLVADGAVHRLLHRGEVFRLGLAHHHTGSGDVGAILGILPPGEEVELPIQLGQLAG